MNNLFIRRFYTMIESGSSADLATVDSDKNLRTNTPYTDPAGVAIGGGDTKAGAVALLSESDKGLRTGTRRVIAPEADSDFRLRVALETLLEDETFNYTAQNSGKHSYSTATLTNAWSAAGMVTNSGSITTTTTGSVFSTRAFFPVLGSGALLYIQFKGSFSNQPVANTIIDCGLFIPGAANPFAPTDGIYFRLNSSGLLGVINHNGTEQTVALPFTYSNNKVYEFLITIQEGKVKFWINDEMYGEIETPEAQGQPMMAGAAPFAMRHVITGGAAGGVIQFTLRDYSISIGGINLCRTLGEYGNASFGAYQGLSGGTMGPLASYANSANPTAAVPTNTTSTVLTALGGQGWETDTLAVNTDGVIMSYQIPVGTANALGKRLRLTGIKIDSYVQTALTGGGYNAQFVLCWGHTAVSLATSETTNTKSARRLPIGSYSVASGLAVLTQLPTITLQLQNPVYVNPGEFIAIAKKKVGTAPSAGVIAYLITLDYSWE